MKCFSAAIAGSKIPEARFPRSPARGAEEDCAIAWSGLAAAIPQTTNVENFRHMLALMTMDHHITRNRLLACYTHSGLARRCARRSSNSCLSFDPTENQAFEEYRADTLRSLEDEERDLHDFLDHLRAAKDKQEFDDFLAHRRAKPESV